MRSSALSALSSLALALAMTGNAAAQYPRIGGQHAKYNAATLRLLRTLDQQKVPQPAGVDAAHWQRFQTMASIAGKLTDAEIDALASYVNGLH